MLQKENPAPMGVLDAGLSSIRLLEDKRPDHEFAFTAGSRSTDIKVGQRNGRRVAPTAVKRAERHKERELTTGSDPSRQVLGDESTPSVGCLRLGAYSHNFLVDIKTTKHDCAQTRLCVEGTA